MKLSIKGFSLIEVMIVIAIIGILSAIAIPNFMNYQMASEIVEKLLSGQTLNAKELKHYEDYKELIDRRLAKKILEVSTAGTDKTVKDDRKDDVIEIKEDSAIILLILKNQLAMLENQRRIIKTEYSGADMQVFDLERRIRSLNRLINQLDQ